MPRIFNLTSKIIIILLAIEVILRVFGGPDFARWFVLDERNEMFDYDPELGWIGRPSANGTISGARTVQVRLNSDGFRDEEFYKQSQKPAILFLGDSFVWGYDVEQGSRFTDLLQERHPEWRILNLGISGYGTDQEYLLLQKYLPILKPTVVVVVVNTENDRDDNSSTERYFGYFKPAFISTEARLERIGAPVPKGLRYRFAHLRPILRVSCLFRVLASLAIQADRQRGIVVSDPTERILDEMNYFVRQNGSKLGVSFIGSDSMLQKHCDSTPTLSCLRLPNAEKFTAAGNHWTVAAHNVISHAFEEYLPVLLDTRKP